MIARPNTFIVGAPRCGTTAWVSYLSGHPEIGFSELKEPHFFCTDFEGFRWAKTLDAYHALFQGAAGRSIIAEASVQYLYSREAAARLRAYAPQAKILIFLRQQRTFLPSYHSQLRYNGDETIPEFAEAWARSGRRAVPKTCREPSFLDYPAVGRFDEQVARFADAFPPEQIHVLHYENWIKDPRAAYLDVLAFLGLRDDGRTEFAQVHRSKRHRNRVLAHLTQRPPNWVLRVTRGVRAATGQGRLGWAATLRHLNMQPGAPGPVAAHVLDDIDGYYAGSNARLSRLLAGLRAA